MSLVAIPGSRVPLRAVLLQAVIGFSCVSVSASGFSLRSEKPHYLLGEPVYLRIGALDAVPPSLEEGTLILVIRGPGNGERDYHPPIRLRVGPERGRIPATGSNSGMPPAEHVSREHARFARLIVSEGGLLFPQSGTYLLRLVAPGQTGATRVSLSDSLEITFKKPVEIPDRRAYAILSKDPAEYGLAVYLEGGQQLRSGMSILNGIAAFPNAYRRVSRFVLCSDWSQDYFDYHGKNSRRLDLATALSFGQWDLAAGEYIPLRTAYRLQIAINVAAARSPSDAALTAARDKLRAFRSTLTPAQTEWLDSF